MIKVFRDIQNSYSERKREVNKHKTHLIDALKYTKNDLSKSWQKIYDKPQALDGLIFLRNFSTSTASILNSYFKMLNASLGFKKPLTEDVIRNSKYQFILKKVAKQQFIHRTDISDSDIFKAIFLDSELSHYIPEYNSNISFQKSKHTIALIDGTLNEIFDLKTFQKGLESIKQSHDQDYIVIKASGFHGCAHNAKLIKQQLHSFIKNNPEKKLWLIGFSKGGVDALHYLKDDPMFCNKHIIGLSTLASPIIGTKNIEHKILKFLNLAEELISRQKINIILKNRDLLRRELQNSLDANYQEKWFQDNYKKLPHNLFYTSLAFESKWYESHIWMALAKLFFQSNSINDGIIEADRALYPNYFNGINLGVVKGHHLIGTRSSTYDQVALLKAHLIFLRYKGLLS